MSDIMADARSADMQGFLPSFPVLFTLGGVVASFISTFFAYGYTRYSCLVALLGFTF